MTTCRVHISVPTVDEDAWEKLEPGVAHPMQRLRAVRQLVDAGIDCGVLMAPIVPGFSTQPAKIERTIKAIADSGARSVGAMVMHLEGGTRDHFMAMLHREYPEMVDKYQQLYASKYVPKDYDKRVQEVVSLMRARYGIGVADEEGFRRAARTRRQAPAIVAARGTSASISTCSWSAWAPSPIAPKPSSVGTPSAAVKLPSEPPPALPSSSVMPIPGRDRLGLLESFTTAAVRSSGGRSNPPVTSSCAPGDLRLQRHASSAARDRHPRA